LKKGSLVFLEGRLKTDKYEANGETKYFTKVVTQFVQFLSDNRDAEPFVDASSGAGEEDVDQAETTAV
jgi:single-strand DNA-binding protein